MVDLEKILEDISLNAADARLLCKFSGLPALEPKVSEGVAVMLWLGDLLKQLGMSVEVIYDVLERCRDAVLQYCQQGPCDQLFCLELIDNTFAAWPGLERPYNFLTGQFEHFSELPYYSQSFSVSGILSRFVRE